MAYVYIVTQSASNYIVCPCRGSVQCWTEWVYSVPRSVWMGCGISTRGCLYMQLCVCANIHVWRHVYACLLLICLSVCMNICLSVCLSVCLFWLPGCLHVWTSVCRAADGADGLGAEVRLIKAADCHPSKLLILLQTILLLLLLLLLGM